MDLHEACVWSNKSRVALKMNVHAPNHITKVIKYGAFLSCFAGAWLSLLADSDKAVLFSFISQFQLL